MSFGVWLKLGRVSNLPSVWSNTLAGCLLAGARPEWPWLGGAALAFSLFYVGGMFLNDAFERELDARERPERPIPSGQVRASSVFGAGFGLLACGIGLVHWLAQQAPGAAAGARYSATLLAAALAALIVFYDVYHKKNPASPLVMGLCRVMIYVTASVAATGLAPAPVLAGALVLFGHLIGLTYAAKQEHLGHLKHQWPLACLLLPVIYGIGLGLSQAWVLAFLALHSGFVVHALGFLARGPRRSIPAAVVRLIAAISLLDALLIARVAPPALALLAALMCVLTRLGQRYVPGT